jgi:23S rRNA (cytosine1962-C5)-methyltransferase
MSVTHPIVQLDSDQLPAGPWVFARQVSVVGDAPENGSLVELQDRSGRYFAHGLFNAASDIRVRILSRGKKSDIKGLRDFLLRKLASADRVRRKLLRLPEVTDAYRIAHAEGDDLPGLIVDRLGSVIVCEHHALGFWRSRADVEWALGELYPGLEVVHSVPSNAAKKEGFEPEEPPRDVGIVRLRENEITYLVRPAHGHKTGFFCDQRDNRLKVAALARGADVLDLCCNTGGFALQAMRMGARSVRAVDLDEVVLERASDAARENRLDIDLVHADAFDVLRGLRGSRERPSVVILDPHKIIRDRARMEEGLRRYGDLNTLALEGIRPGGLLATFSCSGALELSAFFGMLFQSARRAGREVRLLETLGAAPDHPQRPDFSRSRYLKGALLAVD